MDEGAWIEAGLYDPAAIEAAERLELLTFLTEQGCSLEEMVAAHGKGRLFALAAGHYPRRGRRARVGGPRLPESLRSR